MVVNKRNTVLNQWIEKKIKEIVWNWNRTQVLVLFANVTLPTALHKLFVNIIHTKRNVQNKDGQTKNARISNSPVIVGHVVFSFLCRHFRKRDFYLQTSTVGITLHISKMLYTQDKWKVMVPINSSHPHEHHGTWFKAQLFLYKKTLKITQKP